MFRYRCPQCFHLLQAPEIRAGKTTVCSKCSQPLTIPADKARWLNEKGEPLLTSPTVVMPTGMTPPPLRPQREEPAPDADNDVLGAISLGAVSPSAANPPPTTETIAAPPAEPPALPRPAFSRSLPEPDEGDGKVALYPPTPKAETPRPPDPKPEQTPPPRPVPRPTPAVIPKPVGAGPLSRQTATPAPARPARGTAAVAVREPLRLRTGMDIAVDLTAALTTLMKPLPRPPRDLRPSTAVWILATGIALALLAATLLTPANLIEAVLYIGAAEVAVGYGWVIGLAYRRHWQRGVASAVPPLTFWFLTRRKYANYRPLRFVLTGGVLMALAWFAAQVQPRTRAWAGVIVPATTHTASAPDITARPKATQLRYYRDQRQYESLIGLLQSLKQPQAIDAVETKDRGELAAVLKELCKHPDTGVKVEALAAYAVWGGDDARELCLEASSSPNRVERLTALRLLPRWKDKFVARRIAERIGRPGTETTAAENALIKLGGPLAEEAAIALLWNEDQGIRLTAIEILGNERVGGPAAVAALQDVARRSPDPGTSTAAAGKAQLIQSRLKK